jgi:hypothetical protein
VKSQAPFRIGTPVTHRQTRNVWRSPPYRDTLNLSDVDSSEVDMRTHSLTCLAFLVAAACRADDAAVFSGPQAGETLAPFSAAGVLGAAEGRQVDIVTEAAGKPVLIIFVHEPLTRPSAAVTRVLSEYSSSLGDKLSTLVVFLNADRSGAEDYLRRARGSLRLKSPVAVSLDGAEGPGAYGLNRTVSLTVIVGKDHMVTGNFALIQPALTDAPPIVAEIAKTVGVEQPSKQQIDKLLAGSPREAAIEKRGEKIEIPRELLVPVINKQATAEQLQQAIAKVEEYVGEDRVRQQALGEVAARVVNGGKLESYGTPAAQEQLKSWAKKFGPRPTEPAVKADASPTK